MALIQCPECGRDVSERAVTCPNCGARVGNGHSRKANKILVTVLLISAAICMVAFFVVLKFPEIINGDSYTAGNFDDVDDSPRSDERTRPFGVGDSVESQGVQITFLGVTESTGNDLWEPADGNVFVFPEFEFVNNSNEEYAISSIASFYAYQDDYSINLSIEAVAANGSHTLDGSLAPGKKMKGALGYEVPADYKNLEIDVMLDLFSYDKVVFVYQK